MQHERRIAIVGGGAGGIGAAWGLTEAGHHVTLIERSSALGGHARAVPVRGDDGQVWSIDAGVTDFHRPTCASSVALFDRLGLRARPIDQDASFMRAGGAVVWYTRPGEVRFVEDGLDDAVLCAELARFSRECPEALAPAYRGWTLGAYLDARGYSPAFRSLCLYPRARGALPMPDRPAASHPLPALVRSWLAQGVVGSRPGERMTLVDGMHACGPAFGRWLERRGGRVLLGARVESILRGRERVQIRVRDASGLAAPLFFDDVVLAVNAHQVLPMLADATADERVALAGVRWQAARVVVHRDPRLMPARRDAWGAFNYLVADEPAGIAGPTVTVHANRLAGLPAACPDVFVTINPFSEPALDLVIDDGRVLHPVAGADAEAAARRVAALQGARRTWYGGSYLRCPWTHDDALRSGLDAAAALSGRATSLVGAA